MNPLKNRYVFAIVFISIAILICVIVFDSKSLSDWVQAVGSILAVAGAAYLPYWHEAERKKSKKEENHTMLLYDMKNVSFQINEIMTEHGKYPDALLPHVHSFYTDTLNEIHDLGFEAYKLAFNIRGNVQSVNIAIERINRRTAWRIHIDSEFIKSLAKIRDQVQKYTRDLESGVLLAHHTAPPSA